MTKNFVFLCKSPHMMAKIYDIYKIYVAEGATIITEANKPHASRSVMISMGLRKRAHSLQPYLETCRAFASLQSHRRSRHTSCLSGISIQNSWQKAVPINIFSIGSVLLLSEISHIWPLEKAEFDLVCQMLYSHEK